MKENAPLKNSALRQHTVIGRYRDRQVPVELQLSFGAPITSAEDIRGKEEKGKLWLI